VSTHRLFIDEYVFQNYLSYVFADGCCSDGVSVNDLLMIHSLHMTIPFFISLLKERNEYMYNSFRPEHLNGQ